MIEDEKFNLSVDWTGLCGWGETQISQCISSCHEFKIFIFLSLLALRIPETKPQSLSSNCQMKFSRHEHFTGIKVYPLCLISNKFQSYGIVKMFSSKICFPIFTYVFDNFVIISVITSLQYIHSVRKACECLG